MQKHSSAPFDSRQLIMNLYRVIAIGLIGLLSGCASLGTTFSDSSIKLSDSGQFSETCTTYNGEFYAGVKDDIESVKDCIDGRGYLPEVACWFVFVPIIDMPLSFVADTLFLPYIAIRNEMNRDVYRNDRGEICTHKATE
ncbi:MAG: YceK/YidQ family lipoprotein [Sideroxyarcus sp.]